MSLQALAVKIENGIVHTMDGSSLPQNGQAILVIVPETSVTGHGNGQSTRGDDEALWRKPFEAYFAIAATAQSSHNLDELDDRELNAIVHEARLSK